MSNVYVRGEALQSTRQAGAEYVLMKHASRDVSLLLGIIKQVMECLGEDLDADDFDIVDQIATDYGVPRWASDY